MTEALRRTRPDLILTAPPVDYLCDHEMTSLLVRDACFTAPDPQLRDPAVGARAPPRRRSPTSISSTPSRAPTATAGRQPAGFHVDVSRVFELKRQMLACHASQRNWLLAAARHRRVPRQPGAVGRPPGAEIGVAQAEAFRQYLGHPYPHDNLLLEAASGQGRPRSVAAVKA